MFWARGTPEEQGKRSKRLEELRLKMLGTQLTKAEIENVTLSAPPSLRDQMKPIQEEMLALLKTSITNRDEAENTVADIISKSIDEFDPKDIEWQYLQRYKSLQDQLAGLIDNAPNIPHWVPD